MKRFWILLVLLAVCAAAGRGQTVGVAAADSPDPDLDRILARVQERYQKPRFSAFFFQQTTLQAMDITDTAFGRIHVQRPDKMRWEYEKPEPQTIVTDGRQLWIYRPADRQVLVGRAPAFLSDGKGAGFLSDIQGLQEKFLVLKAPESDADHYVLQLVPRNRMGDVRTIRLWLSKSSGLITRIATRNDFGDETRIELSQYVFADRPRNELFSFDIPDGADVVQLDGSPF